MWDRSSVPVVLNLLALGYLTPGDILQYLENIFHC